VTVSPRQLFQIPGAQPFLPGPQQTPSPEKTRKRKITGFGTQAMRCFLSHSHTLSHTHTHIHTHTHTHTHTNTHTDTHAHQCGCWEQMPAKVPSGGGGLPRAEEGPPRLERQHPAIGGVGLDSFHSITAGVQPPPPRASERTVTTGWVVPRLAYGHKPLSCCTGGPCG
jgi:hypothetical protein